MKSNHISVPFHKIEICHLYVTFCDFIVHLQMEGTAVVSSHQFGHFVMHTALEVCLCVYLRGVEAYKSKDQDVEGGARKGHVIKFTF